MVIKSVHLLDFRNYLDFNLQFNSGINLFYGLNGQGKTNLIESLFFLTHLRSFKTPHFKTIRRFGTDSAHLQAEIIKKEIYHQIQIDLFENKKKVLLDKKNLTLSSHFIREYYSILFAPDRAMQFQEYPSDRRSFFDRVLVVIDPGYFYAIQEYNRIKKQKNKLLKTSRYNEIEIWNRLLGNIIPTIVSARKKLAEHLENFLSELYPSITGWVKKLSLHYSNDLDGKIEISPEKISNFLNEKIPTECSMGYMHFGPHRDLYRFTLDNVSDENFSRGEYRLAFLSLLLAVNLYVIETMKFYPILLFDDLFSEMDNVIIEKVINFVSGIKNQVFISTTSLPKNLNKKSECFQIDRGNLVA